jgi:hypothetical protein
MYPPTSVFIAIGRLGIVVLNGLSYPLQCLPCRACVYHMTSGLIKPKPEPEADYQPVSTGEDDQDEPEEDDYDSEDDPLIPQPDVIGKRLRRRVADMPLWKFYLITIGILLFGFIIALLVDELEIGKCIRSLFGFMLITVLGFVGSTGSTIISFILPGFFYFKLFRNEAGPLKWCALALAVYGLCVMGFW